MLGQKLLKVLSISTIHAIRLKTLPKPSLMLLAVLMAGTSRVGLLKGGLLDAIYHQILKDFSEERRGQLVAFFQDVGGDQALLSQIRGEIVHAVWADHLDIIGHFRPATRRHLRTDWLRSMSGFKREDFERVWSDVVAFMLSGSGGRATAKARCLQISEW